jgi:hypothetical protein
MPRVLLFELNEVSWRVLRPLLDRGRLPNLQRMIEEGTTGTTLCRDRRLDPCVAWPTLHTGTGEEVHGIEFLGQHPNTFGASQLWDVALAAGRTVGVFGSLLSWPPRAEAAYYVPECFARDAATLPESASVVQAFNIKYSTENKKAIAATTTLGEALTFGAGLVRSGVTLGTMAAIARALAAERLTPTLRWRRACFQPLINYDVFAALYRRHRPDLGTFFTNHVAYYLHRYWRAAFPDQFDGVPPDETAVYGDAIAYALEVGDQLLGRVMALVDDDTVLVVASALGQGPVERPALAREQNILRSIDRLVGKLGYGDEARVSGSMSHEHIVVCPSPTVRERLVRQLLDITTHDGGHRIFTAKIKDDSVCVSFTGAYVDLTAGVRVPALDATVAPGELHIERHAVQPMTGNHTPDGIFLARGPRVARGRQIGEFDLRDVAPTLLGLLGVAKPAQMGGSSVDLVGTLRAS